MVTSGVRRVPRGEDDLMTRVGTPILSFLSNWRRYGVKKRRKESKESNIGFFIQDQFELLTASQYLKGQ